jgi:hypothetical protein
MRRGSDASRECIDIMDPLLTVYVKRTTCMQVIRKGSLGETGLVHTALFKASTMHTGAESTSSIWAIHRSPTPAIRLLLEL